jgi:Flp pilus assembly protein CpaB
MAGDITDPQTYNRSGIPAGLVALALPVTSGNSVAGRVSRGDLVTLLLVSRESGTSPGHPGTASLLAEGLQVLEVQRGNLATAGLATSGGTVPAATSLTLLVTLEQAARIKAGQEQGSVSVVLLPQVPSARNTGPASGEE